MVECWECTFTLRVVMRSTIDRWRQAGIARVFRHRECDIYRELYVGAPSMISAIIHLRTEKNHLKVVILAENKYKSYVF